MNMNMKIKTCPFCGSFPQFVENKKKNWIALQCCHCFLIFRKTMTHFDKEDLVKHHKQSIIEKWNNRFDFYGIIPFVEKMQSFLFEIPSKALCLY